MKSLKKKYNKKIKENFINLYVGEGCAVGGGCQGTGNTCSVGGTCGAGYHC